MVAAALLRVDKVPEPQVADHGSPASSWSGDKGPEVEQSKEKRRWCGALGELWIPASAGMTGKESGGARCGRDSGGTGMLANAWNGCPQLEQALVSRMPVWSGKLRPASPSPWHAPAQPPIAHPFFSHTLSAHTSRPHAPPLGAHIMSTPQRPLTAGDWLGAAGVVLIWGLNFVVMKVALQDLSPMLLGVLRFSAASLPFLLFLPRPNLPWRFMVGYGLTQGLGQFGFLFLGLELGMPAGMASVVMQTQAFVTLLLAGPVLGERTTPWQWAGLVLALGGLTVIGSAHGVGPADMTLVGFLLTLAAAAMWALSNLVARRAAAHAHYDALPFIAWSSLFPILPFLALSLWMDGGPQGLLGQFAGAHWPAWAAVVYLALLATLLAYSLWTRLLQRHPAARVTPFSLLVPVVGLLAAGAFLAEWPNRMQWIGTAGVLAGLLVNQFGARLARMVRA